MLFQNHKIIMTACTSVAFIGFSLGGANASETALNTDSIHFQGQKYRYPPAEAFKQPVQKTTRPAVTYQAKPVSRAPAVRRATQPVRPQPIQRPMAGNYNGMRPYSARPYPALSYPARSYPAKVPMNQPAPYGRPGMAPRPYARTAAVPPGPQARPGYVPPPPRPAGAPPLNPPFAGPGGRPGFVRNYPGNRSSVNNSSVNKSEVVIIDPDIPKEYAKNPYINGTYNSKPPPPINRPGSYNRGSKGPMGFGPFNGNDAPWETWPFGNKDSFWSRKEFPFKRQNPGDWFKPNDPKEGLAVMWDDLISAPDDLGTMPGGWNVPSISTPNPVDLEDQLQKASKEVPDLIRVYNE